MRISVLALPFFSIFLSAQQTVLNLSHELVTQGIAASNLTPGMPALDARPLVEAGLAYANANGIATVTADPGAYYFLSRHNANTHVLISGLTNITLDWQN